MSELQCRFITTDDSSDVFCWRNDQLARCMSRSKQIISSIEHANWFGQMLDSRLHVGIIGELSCEKIGVVFFLIDEDSAKVSINLNPLCRGKKLATILLGRAIQKVQESYPQIHCFIAEIKYVNHASIKVFRQNGFKLNNKQDGFGIYLLKSINLGGACDD